MLRIAGRRRGAVTIAGVVAAAAVAAGIVAVTAATGTLSANHGTTADQPAKHAERAAADERIDGLRQEALPAVTRDEIIQRAKYWLDQGIPYNRDAYNSVPGPDGVKYTPDCSGYASMVWKLGTSHGSGSLPGIARELGSTNDLLRGDILVAQIGGGKPTGHVAIFDKWADSTRTTYWGYDHGGPRGAPPRYAVFGLERPNDERVYVPYRHPNLTESGTPGDASQPDGDVNEVVGGTGTISIRGWAVDADTPAEPINVHVYLTYPDGHRQFAQSAGAALSRPDVAEYYPQYGPEHGFETTLSGLPPGDYGVEVFGIDSSGNADDYTHIQYGRTKPTVFVNVS